MKKLTLTLLLLLFSFTAQAQLQLISGGHTTSLVASGGQVYTQDLTLAADATLKTADDKAYTVSGIITGAFNLTADLAPHSTLTLSGANTYSGSTGVTGGELILTNTSAFKSSALSVSAGAILTIDASAYGQPNSDAPHLVFGSTASNLTVTGAGQVNFKGAKSKYYGVNISSDKSMVFHMSSGGQLNIINGNWKIGASGVEAFSGNSGSLNVAVDAQLIIYGTTAQFDKVTGPGRIHSPSDAVNDITIKIGAGNGACNWDGKFDEKGFYKINIEKVGTGTIAFTNINLQSGIVTITAGALSIGNGGDSGTIGSGNIINNASLILNLSKKSNISRSIDLRNAISGTGNFVKKGDRPAYLYGDTDGILNYTGTTTVESGELTLVNKEIKNSGISVQSGAALAVYPNTTNNGTITSDGGLSMTAGSILRFAFTTDDHPYAKLVVPHITAPDGFIIKFTGDAIAALSGDKILIGCTGTLPAKLPTIAENSINRFESSKKCIVLKWVQGTGLVGTIKAGAGPVIAPDFPANLCVGMTQRYTISSGGTPATPAWTSSNPEVVSVSNAGVAKGLFAGTGEVTYSNTDGCRISAAISVRGHVLRLEDPNAAFCAGKKITLKAYNSPEGGATSMLNPAWTSDNKSVATVDTGDKGPGEPVAYINLLAPGTTTINFSTGDMCDAGFEMTVKDSPVISPPASVVCVGSTITFTAGGTAATTNPWTSAATRFATITSAGIATGVAAGEAAITFTSGTGCTATTLLSVKAAPIANAGEDKEICAGISVTIGAPAQPGVTCSWSPATGLSAFNTANPAANPATTTTYTLTVSIGGSQCPSTDQAEVRVNPLPTLTSAQGTSSFIQPDATIELTASTNGTANSWATDDESIVTIAAGTDPKKAMATGVAPGNTNITYTDVKGCLREHLIAVSNRSNQTITFDPIADKTMGGANFMLSAKASSGLSVAFSTASDKVRISGNSVTILKAGKAGIQADQAGNESYNPAPQVSKTFCINPPAPTATYNPGNKTLTSSATEGNQWFLNDKAIPGATANTHIVASDGSYTVKATVEDCVSAPSESKAIAITGDIADGELQIFPNPVHDQLVIELPSHENGLLSIFSITGQNLYSTAVEGKTVINMKSFPVGIYILKIQTAERTVVRKVVKK